MKAISPRARTNLELILQEIDALCKGLRFPQKKSRRGRKPEYSNKLIVKLVVVQHLLGFTSERSFLRFVPELKCEELSNLPDQSQYNRRAKSLKTITDKLISKMSEGLKVDKSRLRILDTTAVPVIKLSRAPRRKILTDKKQVAIGYCAVQKTHYCGLKLNLLVNQQGVPCRHYLKPANKSDIRCLEEILVEKKNIKDVVLIADKGYISDFNKSWVKDCWRITLITPYRRNQKKTNTKRERQLLKKRRIIETVIGQLKDQMNLEKLRAKSYQGLSSRIDNIIFTFIFGVYFNKKYHRNPLNLKSILT
ncbi:hypothetical protein COX73_02685 [bacterium (Candidatus Gribaldobacteria) CG_4_10_14_0_2_um_filter_36_18]|uniref:Transposase DDE domain-containing protein n=1 Tax=bacterium (Candidatus Gribaldobacteria) CG_4_10_14_0_2_um_filter_36_18 TaxID=2014264 RepID=A0A2M7VJY8_9BACT|nr:MAG: hypothetical protein COX73_02685 [bacterium (Candidatus Gribaldobacteria) CG_4_10_14_0_2_um_filter_36_18]